MELTDRQIEVIEDICKSLPARHNPNETAYILLNGGRGSGKTIAIIYMLIHLMIDNDGIVVLIGRKTRADVVKSIWNQSLFFVLENFFPNLEYEVNRTELIVRLKNGSYLQCMGVDANKDDHKKLKGFRATISYLNEAVEISEEAYELICSSTTKKHFECLNMVFCDCNPWFKRVWVYRQFVRSLTKDKQPLPNSCDYFYYNIHPFTNEANNNTSSLRNLTGSARTTLLEGEWLDEAENAYWKFEDIEQNKIYDFETPKSSVRFNTECWIDPSFSFGENSDNTGVVSGYVYEGKLYVISSKDDFRSHTHLAEYVTEELLAGRIESAGIEGNGGGSAVAPLIESIAFSRRLSVNVQIATVSKSKSERLLILSEVFKNGKIILVGDHKNLETEMLTWYPEADFSPGLLDALWLLYDSYKDFL